MCRQFDSGRRPRAERLSNEARRCDTSRQSAAGMTLWGEDMAGAWEWSNVSVGDGRVLEVLTSGPRDGVPLLFHHGTPMAAAEFVPLRDLAAAQGLRTVLYSRPGYAQSLRHAGRPVAAVASDVAAARRALAAHSCVSLGWSWG